MFPNYRHAPIVDRHRKRCPVCNQAVYSLAGIHPQCAVRLADPPKPKSKAKGDPSQGNATATHEANAVALSPIAARIPAVNRPHG
jgi:hypothetical protein